MARSRKVHLEAQTTQFVSGGKIVRYTIVVDPAAGTIAVREHYKREVAEIPLGTLAQMVMNKHYEAKARAEQAEKPRRRLVSRSLL